MHPLFHPLFTQFITYFNEHEDYFECHEVLEEYWKEIAPSDKTHPLTALILLATGMYHWRRDNFIGAQKSLKKASERIQANASNNFYDGIHLTQVVDYLHESMELVQQKKSFRAFKILIISPELIEVINKQPSLAPLVGDNLIHKHMLRDRSEVLKAREEKRRNRH
ncbi:DUF309 domain-containing protein [Paenisporosarcina sp. TG-14]|uniref:DUF309 domain-containing protein n=1 Tax=Paenisporosarcina sp. TG-14 TaxID=1231057 RepID=UPI0002E2FC0B|nr:DUF309 domain-containing protein [Paenisporosarcina sp. TG-14]